MNDNVIDIIKRFSYKGAYDDLVRYIESLPTIIQLNAAVLLQKYRAFLRQGHAIKAEATLLKADITLWTAGEQLIHALELACIKIFRYLQIDEASRAANEAFEKYKNAGLTKADLSEAQRIYARIQIAAATYKLICEEDKERAVDGLKEIEINLNNDGRIDEALASAFSWAENQKDLPKRLEALTDVANKSVTAGRIDLAAEAYTLKGELMLKAGYDTEQILTALNEGEKLYSAIEHVYGSFNVRRLKAMLNVSRNLTTTEELSACLEAYESIHYFRGMLSLLMDLSHLAHENGDARLAASYRDQMLLLTEKTGMGITRNSVFMSEADLCTRNADYGTAIEICQAAIASCWPAVIRAGYEVLLSSAYSFIDDHLSAIQHARKAVELYMSVGAVDYASDIIAKLASDISAFRNEASWSEAESLLHEWLTIDEKQNNLPGIVSKLEMLAQVKLNRFNFSNPPDKSMLPDAAMKILQTALGISEKIPGREGVKRTANLIQLMGQVSQVKGDEEGIIQFWKNALSNYHKAGFSSESTNCHYMLGVIYLNRAYTNVADNFEHSEVHLKNAIAGYDMATMREKSADARYMLALLYTNASIHVNDDLRNQLLDRAVELLYEGEADYDSIRREFRAGDSVTRVQAGKQALIKKSQRISQLALQIVCLHHPNTLQTWHWVQRAKARGLTDILGISAAPPAQVISAVEKYPASMQLIDKENEITLLLKKAPLHEQMELRKELQSVWEKMRTDEYLADYLEIRSGAAVEINDIEAILAPLTATGQRVVCIDWTTVGDLLYLVILQPGNAPQLERLPIGLGAVQAFIQVHLTKETFRSNLRDTPEILRELDALIAPLAKHSYPNELLILSPTGPLYGIPLHALQINGETLIERNPVIYCQSLSILRYCLLRKSPITQEKSAALFGDPTGDRIKAGNLVSYLAVTMKTRPYINNEVTRETFTLGTSNKDIIHFQGHAVYNPSEPLSSYLSMANGPFTANDIFNLHDLRAELVTLAACESASSHIAAGDEPLGLIPAFLYAGARSVIATLWKVNQSSAAELMRLFYDKHYTANGKMTKAQALREAVLNVKGTPGFESPYHWAPFVLYGDWH